MPVLDRSRVDQRPDRRDPPGAVPSHDAGAGVAPASLPLRSGVSVIIPAFDEEAGVEAQVTAIRDTLAAEGITHEIIVVDDGSEDRTADLAERAGAQVLRHPHNRGYGSSIKTGMLAARYETIVISDADGTYPAAEIPALVAQLEHADMVVGARVGNDVAIPPIRRPAKWVLGKLASYIAGQPIPDLNSGLRAFRRECVRQYFPILSNGFSFTTTSTLALLADDYQVAYHPINYYRRIGSSKIVPSHFGTFLMLVLKMSMMFQPLKIFLPMALASGALGLLKTLYDVVTLFLRHDGLGVALVWQPLLSTSATLLLLSALHLLLVGMVADGLLRRIAQQRPLVPTRLELSRRSSSTSSGEAETASTGERDRHMWST